MSEYKSYTPEQLQELDSLFLISTLSYSKVSQWTRNQKAFEMLYVYGYRQKNSSTTVAGQAYHYALEMYFKNKKEGIELSIVDLETLAFNYIDEQPASEWKIQKTTPTIEECKLKANDVTVKLIGNFFREIGVYLNEIEEILEVELFFSEFLTINGVDIPIRFNGKIDLIARTKDGKIVGIDHKSKATYTDEKELVLTSGKQSCVYVKAYESMKGILLDEFWFAENKHSANKDKSSQIQISKIEITKDVLKLYEAYLYTPLKSLLIAVSSPDYDYLINDADNFVDIAEIYAFDAKTRLGEIDSDFNIEDTKLDLIEKRTKKIKDASATAINPTVIKTFIKNASKFIQYDMSDKTQEQKIEHVLRSFGMQVSVAKIFDGFSSDTYLLEIGAGVKVGAVQKFKLDIANQLNVANVRIPTDLTVYEGKSYLQIEISKKRERDLIWDISELKGMKIPLGKDNMGNIIYWDFNSNSAVHQLVCASTGAGKSVYLKSILHYALEAGVKEIHLADPKFEFEYMKQYGVNVYNEIEDIEEAMRMLVEKMDNKVRNKDTSKVLIAFDEFADALAAAGKKSDLDHNLKRILQKGRSSGFRVIAATQRASVKVIDGDAKVNFSILCCLRVPKAIDSKVVLGEEGAELLSGSGDCLISSPDYLGLQRFQAFYKPD
jgi:hypothetical protein